MPEKTFKYEYLTADQRQAAVQNRIAGLESEYFNQTVELAVLEARNIDGALDAQIEQGKQALECTAAAVKNLKAVNVA